MECVKTKKSHLNRWLASSYKNVRFRAVQGVTFRCNMWMLLIVKLLSFKRYNYPFYKCRESGRQMQCSYSQPVSDEVVPLLFSLFLRFWKQMQCIVSQPLPFLVLQNAYLVAKIQIYIGLEQTIILKNIIPQLLFSIILSHHFMYHSQ